MNTKQDYIAVFDSGVGGISVLRHLRRLMPGERYLYFGDSANAPYGTKTKDEVEALTFAAARRLMARGVKALVVACNTATSAAIHDLREAYPDTIVIGTTHSVGRAGKPQLITPLIIDQPYWSYRIHQLGLGPEGLKIAKASEQEIERKVCDLVTNPLYKKNAAHIGEMIQKEGGIKNICDSIERFQ